MRYALLCVGERARERETEISEMCTLDKDCDIVNGKTLIDLPWEKNV